MQLIIEITYNCPCHCSFCNVPKNNEVMDILKFSGAIDLFKSFDSNLSIVLSGGEPSTVKNLKEYVSIAKKKNCNVTIVTNAFNFYRIIKAKPDFVEISIDYFGEKHDLSRGFKGLFLNAIKLAEACNFYNISVIIRATAMNDNIDDIVKIKNFFEEKKIEAEFLAMPVRGNPSLLPSKEQLKILEENGISIADNCPAGISSFVLTPRMEVLPCIFYRKKLGEINNFSLSEMLEIINKGEKIPRFPCEKE
jgi:MoaA/NifB/PqqE/SkfB family radical SAM enzyme